MTDRASYPRWYTIPAHLWILAGLLLTVATRAMADQTQMFTNPCTGASGLLAELDRPTVADSACVARPGRVIVELGYAHEARRPQGTGANFPQAELRFGLADHNEFVVVPPNYSHHDGAAPPMMALGDGLAATAGSRYSATVLGVKHEFGYTQRWITTGEVLFTTPTNTSNGSVTGWGTALNGIVSYSVNNRVALGLMLGVTSQYGTDNIRYTSLNPDFTATWLITPQLQLYGEVYGQTKTAYDAGSGWDADYGLQYLIHRWWEIDVEAGNHLQGALGSYSHYIGFGTGFEF